MLDHDGKNRPIAQIEASLRQNSITNDYNINLQMPASNAIIWLGPETFDLTKKIKLNGKFMDYKLSIKTLLEDVRMRRDRQHPFWGKIELFRKQSAWKTVENESGSTP